LRSLQQGADRVSFLRGGKSHRSGNRQLVTPPAQTGTRDHLPNALPGHLYAVIATIHEDHEKLVVRPTSHEICGAESAFHSLCHDVQNGGGGLATVGGAEVLQAVYLNGEDAEWKVIAGETREIFAQVKLGELLIGDAGGFVHATMGGQGVPIAVSIRGKLLLVKTLRHSDDGAARIADRSNPHHHVDRMSLFVAQLHLRFVRLALMHGSSEWTGCAAGDTALTVAVNENIVPPGVPDYFVPLVSSQPFSPLVPEPNCPVSIGHTDTRLQAVQHDAENLRILKIRHKKLEDAAKVVIGKKGSVLQSLRWS
jgi:hypothetical protein